MKTKTKPPYDGPIKRQTVEGWVCQECQRFWGEDERAASYCCATKAYCAVCGGETADKIFSRCESCSRAKDISDWMALPAIDYADQVVAIYSNDDYFFDRESLLDYLAAHSEPEHVMLVVCELRRPKWSTEVAEVIVDQLPEGPDLDSREIDEVISHWVDEHAPDVWYPTDTRISLDSLRDLIVEAQES